MNNGMIFNHSHHLLKVRGSTSPLDVLSFKGEEALSTPFLYAIRFTSTDKAIRPESMLMQDGSLTLQAPTDQGLGIKIQQPVRVIQGVVTGFKQLSTSKDESRYELRLQPRLALLSRSHQNAIYQDMSVQQIVDKILRERHSMRGQDFVFRLAKEYPRREQVMQYGEDDLTFISRLLSEVGIWYRVTTDSRLNIDVVEFYDDQQFYQQGLRLPAVPPSGMHDSALESVWEMSGHHQVVEKTVSVQDYNYRTATEDLSASAGITQGAATTYGEAYHYADNYLTAGSAGRSPVPESGAFYARIRHERYLNGQTRLTGMTNCATLTPGQEMKVTGGGEGIAQVSPQSIQISTGNNFIQTSAENSDFTVFKKFTVAAGEIISLFAKALGIKIFANQGKVEIQAQSDAMALTSLKDMKIISKDDEVYIQAGKKITLACDKTALVIDSAGVKVMTPGEVNLKCMTFNRQMAQPFKSSPVKLPPNAICVEMAK